MTAQMSAELSGIDVVKAFVGDELEAQSIRIVTGVATPHISGARNTGRWTVTATIMAASQVDDFTEDSHDNLAGLIEAYVLQGNSTLCAALTDASLAVEVVQPGDAGEVAINGMRQSAYELICECRMKG